MMNNNFPWCKPIWEQLIASDIKNRFPHAILFYGQQGLGKTELALQIAGYLLCSDPDKNKRACEICKDCILFSAETHGDFHHIASEGDSKSIGVDQIRGLKTAAHQKPQRNNRKVFVMPRADKMTIAASNALLKILEEPPGDSIFILTSESKQALPSTILSRCQCYGFTILKSTQLEAWLLSETEHRFSPEIIKAALLFSSNAPLLAKTWLEENKLEKFLSCSEAFKNYFENKIKSLDLYKILKELPLSDVLNIAYVVCYDLLKTRTTINKKILYTWLDKVIEIKTLLSSQIALNEGLLLEYLLVSKPQKKS